MDQDSSDDYSPSKTVALTAAETVPAEQDDGEVMEFLNSLDVELDEAEIERENQLTALINEL